MKKIDIGQSAQILANLGVIAGLVFVAVEIRTNTATNQIAVYQATSSNWMQVSGQVATNDGLAAVVEKALAGQPLSSVENLQFYHWYNQQLTHGAFVRRLYESDLFSEEDFRLEFGGVRALATFPAVREFVESMPDSGFRDLLLASEDEFNELIREPGAIQMRP